MKIISVTPYIVPPRWAFLRIETDEGIVGWGEPVVEGKVDTVVAAVKEFGAQIIGLDPLNIEYIWNLLYRGNFYRGGPILMSAIAGIDQSLWDIKGKYYNAPVSDLLGGACREYIKAYTWIGGDSPSEIATQAKQAKDKGFAAIKMNGTAQLSYLDKHSEVDALVERVSEIRDTCGKDFGIAIDFHGRVHRAMVKILFKELEPLHPMFIEEPVLTEHLDCLQAIVGNSSIPIATGERMYTKYEFAKLFEDRMVDIIQPDLSHAGGISECYRIAAIAQAYDVALAPHCPLGPIALAACLQLDAVSYNAIIQEQSAGIHYHKNAEVFDYVKNKEVLDIVNGNFSILKNSGLGIDIDEDVVIEQSKTGHNWHNPLWFHEDGRIAEW